jgi:pimeloyl-ACP methyl ester carboxylesterase
MGALAFATPAWGQSPFDPLDPLDQPAAYCPQTPGAVVGEATTDAEHRRIVPERPLPPGVTRRRLSAAGAETAVLEAGRPDLSTAVVFVHGNPGSSEDFAGLVAAVAPYGRAIALDVPGLGRASDAPGGPYSTDGAAGFLDAALAALGVERAHLVLHDLGGPWGLQWAVMRNEVVDSAVLINTGVFIGYFGHPTAHVWHTPGTGEAHMASTTRETFTAFLQQNNPKPLPQAFVDRMYDDFDRPTRCAVLQYYRDIDDPDGMGRAQAAVLRTRPRPALVVWGARDPFLPSALAERQRQAFPDARIEMLPDAGHWPFVDEPERVRDLVVGFLREVLPPLPPPPPD